MLQRLCFIIFVFSGGIELYCQADTSFLYHQDLSAEFLENQYLMPSIDHLLDNFVEGVHLQLDGNSTYSKIDDLIFAIEGNSYQWNKHYLNGHRIDNPLNPGTSFYKPQAHSLNVSIDRPKRSIRYLQKFQEPVISLNLDQGQMGGRLPHSDEIVNAIYGHLSAFERSRGPLELRKKVDFQIEAHLNLGLGRQSDSLSRIKMNLLAGRRLHVSHNYAGMESLFSEDFFKMDAAGNTTLLKRNWNFLAGYSFRDRDGAELGFNHDEQGSKKRFYFSFFSSHKKRDRSWNSGINFIWEKLELRNPDFYRNLVDQDGEAFEPWRSSGRLMNLSHHFEGEFNSLHHRNFTPYLESYNSLIHFSSIVENYSHPIYYQSSEKDRVALEVLEYSSNPFWSGLLENEIGIKFYKGDRGQPVRWVFNGHLSLDGMVLKEKSKFTLNWNISTQLDFNISRILYSGIRLSRERVPFHFNHIKFLSEDYLNGAFYIWEDQGDLEYENNEKAALRAHTGGIVHQLNDGLQQPVVYRLSIPVHIRLGHWRLGFTSCYKTFRKLWTVEYDRNASEVGKFAYNSGSTLYYTEIGKEFGYEVRSFDTEKMTMATGTNSVFFNNPFYASLITHIEFNHSQWYFYLSFQALMAVGFGPLGNGLLHNNLDILSENLANPNNYIHYLGRLNSDRSFVGRMLLSYQLNNSFSFALQVKFKDGQPFNFFDTALLKDSQENDRFIIWNNGIKGDNPFTGEFNSRTDGLWNWEFRIKFAPDRLKEKFKFLFYVYNLFDLGMEIREFVFLPAQSSDRSALEIEVPRGMSLKLIYSLD